MEQRHYMEGTSAKRQLKGMAVVNSTLVTFSILDEESVLDAKLPEERSPRAVQEKELEVFVPVTHPISTPIWYQPWSL